ncbi:hypothetical protein [Haladaptatus sp. DFWS20]|uniref:hypothetical protein n=1 Tax=Haladaptatus sp. DFWS20 TaxID=3403467 RepID=UPI003EC0287A
MTGRSRRSVLKTVGALTGGVLGATAITTTTDRVRARQWLSRRQHPRVPFFRYAGSLQMDAVCYWAKSGCTYWSLASLADPVPGDFIPIAGGCAGTHAGCKLQDNLQRLAGCDTGWVHIYTLRWWARSLFWMFSSAIDTLLLPQGVYGPCQ